MPQPRLAAKRAPLSELPSLATRTGIAEAVHTAIVQEFGEAEARVRCLFYAQVGANVAAIVTGRSYQVMAGSLHVVTASADEMGDGLPAFFAMIADDPQTHGLEFHAWIAGQRPGSVEIVDLASRHYEANARALGIPWGAGRSYPPYVWAPVEAVPEGIRLRASEQTMRAVAMPFCVAERARIVRLGERAYRHFHDAWKG